MKYIGILGGSISRADEKDFLEDLEDAVHKYREVDKVIDLIVDAMGAAGYEINLIYKVVHDGYGG